MRQYYGGKHGRASAKIHDSLLNPGVFYFAGSIFSLQFAVLLSHSSGTFRLFSTRAALKGLRMSICRFILMISLWFLFSVGLIFAVSLS